MLKKLIKYSLYLSLLTPLLVIPSTFSSWHFGKTVIFQMLVEILVMFNILHWSRQAIPRLSPRDPSGGGVGVGWFNRIKVNYLDWSIIIFGGIIFVTGITGINFTNSFWSNITRANGVFLWLHFIVWYLLMKSVFRDKKDYQNLFTIAIAGAVIASFTAFFQNSLPLSWQSISGGGVLGNRAVAAGYFLSSAGLASYLFFAEKNKRRYIFLAAALWLIFSVINTGTRGAFVGLLIGAFVGLFCTALIANKKIKFAAAGALIVVVLSLFTLTVIGMKTTWLKLNFPKIATLINVSRWQSGTASTRLLAWDSAWQGIKEKPILGWGMGNYDAIFTKYYNPQFLKFSFAETVWDKPHNWLLEVWTSSGVVGLISYLTIFCIAVYHLIRNNAKQLNCHPERGLATTSPKGVPLGGSLSGYDCDRDSSCGVGMTTETIGKIILVSTLAAYLTQSFFLFESTNTLILFFLILAFISAEEPIVIQNKTSAHARGYGLRVMGYGLFVIFSLFEYNFLPLKASYYLQRAHNAIDSETWSINTDLSLDIPTKIKPEILVFLSERFVQLEKAGVDINQPDTVSSSIRLAEHLRQAGISSPQSPAYPVWEGQIYMILGQKVDEKYYQNAEVALTKASALSPQKQDILFLLGRLYVLKKDFTRAIEVNKKAVNVAPEISISHWFLGLTYVAAGNTRQGLAEIELAESQGFLIDLDKKLYLVDLYAGEKRYDKVIELYQSIIKANPNNINWYIKLATVYAVSGDKVSALALTKQIVAQYPQIKDEAEAFIKKYKLDN